MSLRVLVRADGGPAIGNGHLMRTLALAQYVADGGGACGLLTADAEAGGVAPWRAERMPVTALRGAPGGADDAAETAATAEAMAADWTVVDGYGFAPAFHAGMARRRPYLYFDDLGGDCGADLTVNQNAGAEHRVSGGNAGALLGCAYAMLRRDLRAAAARSAATRDNAVPHILVTFGGYDEDNLGMQMAAALAGLGEAFTATIVCAAGAAAVAAAQAWAAGQAGRFAIVPPGDIVPLMAGADLAICAGGTTALELAALGVPAIIVVLADNQRPGAAHLAGAGCAEIAGEGAGALGAAAGRAAALLRDPGTRGRMRAAGRALVDGAGVERVTAAMRRITRQRREAPR